MELLKECSVCRIKFFYNCFYRLDGGVSNTCQFCMYGSRIYDVHDPDVYMTHLDLPIKEQLDRIRTMKERTAIENKSAKRPCNDNQTDERK